MRRSFTSVVFLASIVVNAIPAVAQGQGGPPAGAGGGLVELANQVTSLQARVAKLESGAFTASDLVGVWGWRSIGVSLDGTLPGGTPRAASIMLETSGGVTGNATLTLRADGTGQFAGEGDTQFILTQGAPWRLDSPAVQSGSVAVTWSLVNGALHVIAVSDPTNVLEFPILPGGRMVVWSTGKHNDNGSSWSQLGLLVKIQ